MRGSKVACVDFDGVVYPNFKYFGTSDLRGGPVGGAEVGLAELSKSFRVVIHSARCSDPEGFEAIREWLKVNGLDYEVVEQKPRAAIYIDDRAICFRGDWPKAIEEATRFKQWQTDDKLRARILRKRRRR